MVQSIRATLVACALGAIPALLPLAGSAQDVAPVEPLPLQPGAAPAQPAPSTTTSAASSTTESVNVETSAPAAPPSTSQGHMQAEEEVSSTQQPAAPTATRTTTSYTSYSTRNYADTGEVAPELPNRPMLATGTTLLVASYLPSVIVGATQDWDGDHYLYYPVAGPWMYLARRDHDATGKALLIVDGLMQDLGALEMLLSLVIPERRSRFERRMADNRMNVLPRVTRERDVAGTARGYSLGLLASGRF